MRLGDLDALKVHISELMLVYSGTELDNAILNAIENAPIITPDKIQAIMSDYLICRCEPERTQGEWIKWDFKTFGAMGDWEYKCSNCGKVYGGEYNFCPNCGAKMKG